MAISAPTRLYGPGTHQASDINSFTTTSFTPTEGTLLVCSLTTQNQAGALNAGNGLLGISQTHSGSWSWTILGNTADGLFDLNSGSNYYGRVFLAYAIVPSSPGAGTITYNFNTAGSSNRNRNIVVTNIYEISGVDSSTPVTQSIEGRNAGSTTLTITFGSSLASSSMALTNVGNSYETTDTNIIPPTGYTELHETPSADAFFNQQLNTSYRNGGTGTSVNWSGLSNVLASGSIAVELKEAPATGNTQGLLSIL